MNNTVNILVAEDDLNIALALKVVLRRAISNAVITTVRDGREALELLQQDNYNLLLSDWNMPQITGLELLTMVRSNPRTEQLPFLMLTARNDVDCNKPLFTTGTTRCISKPFDNVELVEKVIELLGDRFKQ